MTEQQDKEEARLHRLLAMPCRTRKLQGPIRLKRLKWLIATRGQKYSRAQVRRHNLITNALGRLYDRGIEGY